VPCSPPRRCRPSSSCSGAPAGRLVNDLRALGVTLDKLPTVEVSPDSDDNYLLAFAAAGAADFLVTGHKRHLVGIAVYQGTKIVTVRDFLALHGRRP
jgi:predicted nucleic acid-binding protein